MIMAWEPRYTREYIYTSALHYPALPCPQLYFISLAYTTYFYTHQLYPAYLNFLIDMQLNGILL
jgi:hypothetical protein